MFNKIIVVFLTFVITNSVYCASKKITVTCPPAAEVSATAQTGSWAKYKYSATTFVDLPNVNNHLQLTGEGYAEKALYFTGATWTDRTFLCLYNQSLDVIVIFDWQLDPFVERCYFQIPRHSECNATSPELCPMTCETIFPESGRNT